MRSTFFQEEETRRKLADFILRAPRLSMGKECEAFEQAFATYHERKSAVLVGNGSVANLGLLQALLNLGRLKRGDAVGISAVTWATNVMPVMQLGLIPIALDCAIGHLNVTLTEVRKHIDSLRAVFITNALGFAGDLDKIRELCKSKDVLLIEDNCEALGTRLKGTLLGNFGLASTFSFFVGHHLSTIEGGMICTDDEELADMLKMVRAHGWDRNLSHEKQQALRKKHGVDDFHARYTFYESAYNIRTTEIAGFLGSLQLPLLDGTIKKREENFLRFKTALMSRQDLYYPIETDHIERVSNFAMPVICRSREILEETIKRFASEGVETRPVIAGNVTRHPFWTRSLPEADCPNSDLIHAQGFYFPNNPELTSDEVTLLCNLLQKA